MVETHLQESDEGDGDSEERERHCKGPKPDLTCRVVGLSLIIGWSLVGH